MQSDAGIPISGGQADDIFDAVEMLEYLNNKDYLTHGMSYYNRHVAK